MAYQYTHKNIRAQFEKELKNHIRSENTPEFKCWCLAQFIATGKPEFYCAGTTNNWKESKRIMVANYIADFSDDSIEPAVDIEARFDYLRQASYITVNAYMTRFKIAKVVVYRDLRRIKEREGIEYESRGNGVYKRKQ